MKRYLAFTLISLFAIVGGFTYSPTYSTFSPPQIIGTPVCWTTSADSNLIRYDLVSQSASPGKVLFYVNAAGNEVSVSGGILKNGWCCPCSGSGDSGGGGVSELSDLTDVNTGSPVEGAILRYNSSLSRFQSAYGYLPFNQSQINFSGGYVTVRYFGNSVPTIDSSGKTYILTVPSGTYLRACDVGGGPGLLDGSGHFNFRINTTYGTEADELFAEPFIFNSTNIEYIDKLDYNIKVVRTNPSPGSVIYQVQNMDTLSTGWDQHYRF